MSEYLSRFVNWWTASFRAADTQGRVAMIAAPLIVLPLLGCCGMTVLMALISPGARLAEQAESRPAITVTADRTETELAGGDLVPTAEPQATYTERPTYTPLPTYTPRPTHTPLPTSTPLPTAVPATSTPRPSATPAPTRTPLPQPTATLAPTRTLAPTAVLLPTATPLATATQATSGETATVTAVIDGDTIEVSMNGTSYRVRYIGMDTPEVGQACGSEATQANAALVGGQTVRMVKDVSETDRYGRLLRYVYVGNTFVNGALVAGGWAVAKDYPPDTAMSPTLHGLMTQGAGKGCALVAAPLPTSPPKSPPLGSGPLRIVGVNKVAEYVDILNEGAADVDLGGWVLVSEKGNQRCGLGGIIGAGQTLRIWAMAEDAGQGGYNCGFGVNIWNNSDPDPAVLIDPSGAEVSRW